MPRLFYSAGSPYARICRMALREGGLMDRVEEAETTLRDPAAVMLPHNPVGRVPALLLEDATTLTETTLVLSWLDRMGSAPRMLPEDASSMAAYGRVLGLLDGIAVWNREMRRPEHERSLALQLHMYHAYAAFVPDRGWLDGECLDGDDAGALVLVAA